VYILFIKIKTHSCGKICAKGKKKGIPNNSINKTEFILFYFVLPSVEMG